MDEGKAALYAAIIGFAAAIIGAAVGGWASWRAARHSADAALRATAGQILGQAANEQTHWLRQERRQLYARLLQLSQKYRDERHKFLASVREHYATRGRDEGHKAALEVLKVLQSDLSSLSFEIVLLAPRRVSETAEEVSSHLRNCIIETMEFSKRLGRASRLTEEQRHLFSEQDATLMEKQGDFLAACHVDLVRFPWNP
ncbi:hypothetical protein [Streptomyces bugieae]|uniref:Uncharacterized protein n=1 Tax=Streptomyces bugieae TaxID=3098223 RepID=A0ABU7NL47_9ACTN|nr:hypothetical protein [Streptomyces sp. DSM 41528]